MKNPTLELMIKYLKPSELKLLMSCSKKMYKVFLPFFQKLKKEILIVLTHSEFQLFSLLMDNIKIDIDKLNENQKIYIKFFSINSDLFELQIKFIEQCTAFHYTLSKIINSEYVFEAVGMISILNEKLILYLLPFTKNIILYAGHWLFNCPNVDKIQISIMDLEEKNVSYVSNFTFLSNKESKMKEKLLPSMNFMNN
jgi:predicted nucleotide-binding protein (sugar kinase/HSP70/actin superfamily)